MKNILKNLNNGILNENEIIRLLKDDDSTELFNYANELRKKYIGDEIHLRGIIEFSNHCKRQCLYCGIQSQNSKIDRYRMGVDEIIETASKSKYKTIVLQSGEDNYYTDDMICKIVSEIKKMDFAITLSIGEKTKEQYKKYKEAGADRYLLKHETSDRELYNSLDPYMSFKNRINCQKDLKALGFEVGSGIMIGLPTQSLESIAKDIIFFKKMDYDMIGISPFVPHPDTILRNSDVTPLELVKKVVAITRIVMKDSNLPVTTAFSTLGKADSRKEMLQVGANVIMPNITPINVKEKYELYPNKAKSSTDGIEDMIQSIGRKISMGYGFRKNILR